MAGWFSGTANFNPGPGTYNMTSAGGLDAFIAKLNADGSFAWATQIGGAGDAGAYGIALDGSGNIYTCGFFEGTAAFGSGPDAPTLTSAGTIEAFVSKIDASGQFLSARAWRGPCRRCLQDHS